jgi:hypothetical protein
LKGKSKAFRSTHCLFSSRNLWPSILFDIEHSRSEQGWATLVQSQSCNLKLKNSIFVWAITCSLVLITFVLALKSESSRMDQNMMDRNIICLRVFALEFL